MSIVERVLGALGGEDVGPSAFDGLVNRRLTGSQIARRTRLPVKLVHGTLWYLKSRGRVRVVGSTPTGKRHAPIYERVL